MAKSGKEITRPIFETYHSSKSSEAIHFEYRFMGEGNEKYKYVLVMIDDYPIGCIG